MTPVRSPALPVATKQLRPWSVLIRRHLEYRSAFMRIVREHLVHMVLSLLETALPVHFRNCGAASTHLIYRVIRAFHLHHVVGIEKSRCVPVAGSSAFSKPVAEPLWRGAC